jgi:hypothetical protein
VLFVQARLLLPGEEGFAWSVSVELAQEDPYAAVNLGERALFEKQEQLKMVAVVLMPPLETNLQGVPVYSAKAGDYGESAVDCEKQYEKLICLHPHILVVLLLLLLLHPRFSVQ